MDTAQGGFGVFIGFEYDLGYGAFDAFDLIDFFLQDIAELFHARSRNYGNDVKFACDIIDLVMFSSFSRAFITCSFWDGSTKRLTEASNRWLGSILHH